MDKKHRVFVYGTLKKGIHNHRLLVSSDFIGNAYTLDTFKMFHVGFPVIKFSDHPDAKSVYGEVYDVDDETLKRLDSLESEGSMYDRKQINVVIDDAGPFSGDTVDTNVHIYVGNDAYWDDTKHPEYTSVNAHDELEWRP